MTTQEDRKKIWDAIPKIALNSFHLDNAVLVESRLAMLDRLPKGLRALEIGVAEGGFSAEIWKRLAPSHLTLVDPWEGDRYSPGYEMVRKRFHDQIENGSVRTVKSLSVDFLKNCEAGRFDFIYIDTNHTYGTTIQELRLADRVVAPGGFIAGHDYTMGNPVAPMVYGVIQAVSQFCVENNYKFKFLTVEPAGWNSFCLVKI
jgi:predicted O-methyltransferase YrrM